MFVRDTCGCNLSNGEPCSKAFTREHIESIHNHWLGLDHASLDLLLMGSIMAKTSDSLTESVLVHRQSRGRNQE